jgi:hypothetical protein
MARWRSIALPMALFGAAMRCGTGMEPLHAVADCGALLVIIAGGGGIAVGTGAVFGGGALSRAGRAPALEIRSFGAIIMLLGAFMGVASRRSLDGGPRPKAREMRRLQKRAEDILHDYEQTGQGLVLEKPTKG